MGAEGAARVNRGDVVLIRSPDSPASKARPCVVVQRGSTLEVASKITVCPLTSRLHGAEGQRPLVAPTPDNGLRQPSEVEVDWIHSFPRARIGAVIGNLDATTMRSVDAALRRWLDL